MPHCSGISSICIVLNIAAGSFGYSSKTKASNSRHSPLAIDMENNGIDVKFQLERIGFEKFHVIQGVILFLILGFRNFAAAS